MRVGSTQNIVGADGSPMGIIAWDLAIGALVFDAQIEGEIVEGKVQKDPGTGQYGLFVDGTLWCRIEVVEGEYVFYDSQPGCPIPDGAKLVD